MALAAYALLLPLLLPLLNRMEVAAASLFLVKATIVLLAGTQGHIATLLQERFRQTIPTGVHTWMSRPCSRASRFVSAMRGVGQPSRGSRKGSRQVLDQ